jgi:hypothetical protein
MLCFVSHKLLFRNYSVLKGLFALPFHLLSSSLIGVTSMLQETSRLIMKLPMVSIIGERT